MSNTPQMPLIIKAKATPLLQNITWNKSAGPPNDPIGILIEDLGGLSIDVVSWQMNFQNNNGGWLVSDNDSIDGFVAWSGTSGFLPLSWKDLNVLTETHYQVTIVLHCQNTDNGIGKILTAHVNLNITGTSPTAVQTDKQNYNITYNRQSNTVTGDTNISIVNNTNNEVLQMMSVGDYFQPQSSTVQVGIVESTTNPFATNGLLPTSGTKVVSCKLYTTQGVAVATFTVTMTVIESDVLFFEPLFIQFKLRKGLNEVDGQQIFQVINPGNKDYTVTPPSWLTLSAYGSNLPLKAFYCETVNSEAIDLGEYNDFIVINYEDKVEKIPVSLKVISFIQMDLKPQNFALDGVWLHASQMKNNGRFINVKMKIDIATKQGIESFETSYLLPYFNEKAKVNLGEKIQNHYPIYNENLLPLIEEEQTKYDNQLVYRPAVIHLVVEELDGSYNVLHSTTLNSFEVFAGHRPKLFPLFTNHSYRRKLSKAPLIASYWQTGVDYMTVINQALPTNSFTETDVQTVIVYQDNLVNKVELKQNFGLNFIDFPKTEKYYTVQWLNNNLVPEWAVFSGNFKINSEYTHTQDQFYKAAKKYDTQKVSKISVSTGFILKEETALVDEIIQSKKSFIKVDSDVYECFCTSTKLIEEDTERNLINYELEFQIVTV